MAENMSITPVLRDLDTGDSAVFPIDRLRSVRTIASEVGVMYNRKFKTSANRVERTITVTRVK
ncbi:MAG: hypothetical protein HDS13_06055 [Bacteroides sp.]|nr:hypothetical protein [Bacteroides sp.]